MKLPSRRKAEVPAEPGEVSGATGDPAGTDRTPGAKGRPTPKRRDVVGARGPVTAPKTRKEAYARQKEQAKRSREARRSSTSAALTPAQRRAALRSGEILPRRDQGPTRKIARDYVDSHRMFSNYLLWLFPLMIASYAVPKQLWFVQLFIIAVFFAIILEWFLVGRRIRQIATERDGSAEGGNMSIGFYAGSRAYLPRRWRLPAPQVELGEEI